MRTMCISVYVCICNWHEITIMRKSAFHLFVISAVNILIRFMWATVWICVARLCVCVYIWYNLTIWLLITFILKSILSDFLLVCCAYWSMTVSGNRNFIDLCQFTSITKHIFMYSNGNEFNVCVVCSVCCRTLSPKNINAHLFFSS